MQKSIWKNGRKEKDNVLSDVERDVFVGNSSKQKSRWQRPAMGCWDACSSSSSSSCALSVADHAPSPQNHQPLCGPNLPHTYVRKGLARRAFVGEIGRRLCLAPCGHCQCGADKKASSAPSPLLFFVKSLLNHNLSQLPHGACTPLPRA